MGTTFSGTDTLPDYKELGCQCVADNVHSPVREWGEQTMLWVEVFVHAQLAMFEKGSARYFFGIGMAWCVEL